MKVNNSVNKQLPGIISGKSDKAMEKGSADKLGGVNPGDVAESSKVEVSEQARAFNKAKEIAMKADDIDHEKVARLQKMIDSGNYNVDSERVADRLLTEHSKFLD